MIDYDVPDRCGDVLVNVGELIIADFDSIAAVPQAAEVQVLEVALDEVGKANQFRELLLRGKLLRDLYNRVGDL